VLTTAQPDHLDDTVHDMSLQVNNMIDNTG
jgi:hypothetical protein